MKKIEMFDLAVGLGAACSCTQALRDAGLQFLSFPFDWLFGSTLMGRVDLLCDDVLKMCAKGELSFLHRHPWNGKDVYRNVTNGIVLNHDFPAGVPLEQSIEAVRTKYSRRTERLLSLIGHSREVLLVWIGLPNQKNLVESIGANSWEEALAYCHERLTKRFGPGHDFKFIVFENREGVSYKNLIVEKILDFATKVRFDYADRRPGEEPSTVKIWEVAAFLRQHFGVDDYRSESERRSFAARKRTENLKKFGASSGWRLLLGKVRYKIAKHCAKRKKVDVL